MSSGADWTDLLGKQKQQRKSHSRGQSRKRVPAGQSAEREGGPAGFFGVGSGWLGPIFLAVLLIAGVYAVAWMINEGRILPLERVAMAEAPEKVTGEQLRGSLAGRLHPSLLGVDTVAIRDSLERLPWVEEAQVRRDWPATLKLHIQERQALGIWNEQALLDYSGAVFSPAEETYPEQLPRLTGPESRAQDVARNFKDMRPLFEEHGMDLQALSLSARGAWAAHLDDGVKVALGRQEPMQRASRFVAVVPELQARKDGRMKRVDLRYPNGFAVAWAAAEESD
ncbi:cell division protein FtsQ [Halorhodospira halochloris]|uniref:Cell division protein FtsQ n=1 Tax=Halorhodospira halochloris TaxID=1052 RepID=A0A120N021_HALHR|nr:cell division protein FtsQ/DivIB [Halorhodospira halochloris]MBK1651644.1 hypothetical protein [Halorhodospira halochloris]MCG5548155.1 cell division protein FtsQ/DivIB [Halorhodospira halochloris]BAU58508.1 cell division protein FtsQ [Halorhodospira halochloris]